MRKAFPAKKPFAASDDVSPDLDPSSLPVNPQLIEKKVDLNAQDSDGWTALMYAVTVGGAEAVSKLVAAGVDKITSRSSACGAAGPLLDGGESRANAARARMIRPSEVRDAILSTRTPLACLCKSPSAVTLSHVDITKTSGRATATSSSYASVPLCGYPSTPKRCRTQHFDPKSMQSGAKRHRIIAERSKRPQSNTGLTISSRSSGSIHNDRNARSASKYEVTSDE